MEANKILLQFSFVCEASLNQFLAKIFIEFGTIAAKMKCTFNLRIIKSYAKSIFVHLPHVNIE